MPSQQPDHEHVFLTPYERRQLELIEQGLAGEDPRRPQDIATHTDERKLKRLWLVLVIVCAWLTLLGLVVGTALLVLVGATTTAGAFAMYRYERQRGTDT